MKKILFFLCFLAITTSTVSARFGDVKPDYPYSTSIDLLHDVGMISGNPDGSFAPDRTLNRAELAKLIVLSMNERVDTVNNTPKCFIDIDSSAWYASYLCRAKELGIVTGDGGEGLIYRPSALVSYAEALAMISRVYTWPLPEYTGEQEWFAQYIVSAEEQRILEHPIHANQSISRGHIAEIIARSEVIRGLSALQYTGEEMYTAYRRYVR